MPTRIQRKRTKGWRKPAGAIYVGRPSQWGNPFKTAQEYRDKVLPLLPPALLSPLKGKDLLCWCSLDAECHADVLMEAANADDV